MREYDLSLCVCVYVCVCVYCCVYVIWWDGVFAQNMEYRLRFTVLEWSRIEWELTRERGLWGPNQPSPLDKWMLDTVEGGTFYGVSKYVVHTCM